MVEAAERAGVGHFVFFSALGASTHHRTRFGRAKALAEEVVGRSPLRTTIFAPSMVYTPGDPFLRLLEAASLAPLVPMSGRGRAVYQPLWADDAAACVVAALERDPGEERYELAGPETLSHEAVVRLALCSFGRPRPVVKVPTPVVSRALRLVEAAMKSKAPAVWDEAELLEVSSTTPRGSTDVEALGVRPRAMAEVLGPR